LLRDGMTILFSYACKIKGSFPPEIIFITYKLQADAKTLFPGRTDRSRL
jgi:hypothetical protein